MRSAKGILTGVSVAASLTLAATFSAQAATITNGSFELGTDPGSFTGVSAVDSTTITGWTVTAGSVDYIGTYWDASAGSSRSIDMNGTSAGTIQTTITDLVNGTTYRVFFDLAGNPDSGPSDKVINAFSASTTDNIFHFDITGHSAHNMGWTTNSFTFTASSTTEDLFFRSEIEGSWGPALDNVRIEATPLPAALPLFAGGLGVLGLVARRRKRKAAAIYA